MTHKQLYLESERFSPTGNIVPKGIINQLGRTKLDILAILLREAVQNSWDARASDNLSVEFAIKGYFLDKEKREFLKNTIFAETPPDNSIKIKSFLESEIPIYAMALCDRGTIGLGGPTRADIIEEKEPRDFVDFLRNIGQPTEKKNSGGTYGFGKASFYRASHFRTICVHTRCLYKNRFESRFISSALGESFEANKIRYTGRHWWGQRGTDLIEPILDDTADEFANILGLPPFLNDERGTSILILQPVFSDGEQTPIQMLTDIANDIPRKTYDNLAETILWHFWPKMLKNDQGVPAMEFKINWEGQDILIPDPEDHPLLHGFAKAMRYLHHDSSSVNDGLKIYQTPIKNLHPNQQLGKLAIQQFNINQPAKEITNEDDSPHFTDVSHHIALMRQPELIVKYLPGPPLASSWVGYAGVFITDPSVDEIFADSEPPTHDNWVPESLEKRQHKLLVKSAIKLIQKELEAFATPPTPIPDDVEVTPLGAFSNQLGNWLLSSIPGGYASFEPFPTKSIKDKIEQKGKSTSEATSPANSQNTTIPPQLSFNQTTAIQPAPSYGTTNGNDLPIPKSTQNKKSQELLGKAQISLLSEGLFTILDDQPVLKIDFVVKHANLSSGTTVTAAAFAVIDGTQSEIEPPIGASKTYVLRWISPANEQYEGSENIFIPSSSTGTWSVYVSVPDDIMLGVNITPKAEV